jgi:hypothetical protein
MSLYGPEVFGKGLELLKAGRLMVGNEVPMLD